MHRSRPVVILASLAAAVGVTTAPSAAAAAPSAAASGASSSSLAVQFLGQRNVSAVAAIARSAPASSALARSPHDAAAFVDHDIRNAAARAAAVQLGNPTPLPVTTASQAQAIDGIDHTDSRLAYNGNAYNGEPPDGDICAGSTAEVEILNSALQFFDPLGNILTPPIANNQFMGLPPEKDRSVVPNTFPGPANSDINCTYDSTTGRFFLMTWGLDQDFTTGNFTGKQAYYIAVQATANPIGNYNLYKLPLEAPTQKVCDGFCEADYPQSTTDANSYILSYNRFIHGGNNFAGGRLVVLSKQQLLAGSQGPAVLINPGKIGGTLTGPYLGAQVVPGVPELTGAGGTHYFVSSLDPDGTGDTRIALVALTNTSAIDSANPMNIHVQTAVVSGVNAYAIPNKLSQKPGPRPLGTNLHTQVPGAPNEPLPQLDGGDDRVQPAKYANGQIWTLIDTKLANGNTGLLWLEIKPTRTASTLTGSVTNQGYLSVATNNLDYGDIAVSPDGSSALVVASMVGPTSFPSAVYLRFAPPAGPDRVHVYLAGPGPEDGFSCYDAFGPGATDRGCRWGDYSMANINPSGVFWFETEYTTARARLPLANWGTAIGSIHS
jgi:hypothetical protein